MSPRPFERPATIALPDSDPLPDGSALEGLWLPARGEDGPRGGAVMAAPHPLMGGSMESPVATEVALAASDAGYGSLRFNWRGVGGSAGTASGEVDDADRDYRAALSFIEAAGDDETGGGRRSSVAIPGDLSPPRDFSRVPPSTAKPSSWRPRPPCSTATSSRPGAIQSW